MGDVAEKCGADVAKALMENLPGSRFYVPAKFTERGPLAQIGREYAEALIAEYGGDFLYVPSKFAMRPSLSERFDEIEKLVDKGLTTSQIAAKLGISQTYVFQIRKSMGATRIAKKPDARQLSFFK